MSRAKVTKKAMRAVLQRQSKANFYINLHTILPSLLIDRNEEKTKEKTVKCCKTPFKHKR